MAIRRRPREGALEPDLGDFLAAVAAAQCARELVERPHVPAAPVELSIAQNCRALTRFADCDELLARPLIVDDEDLALTAHAWFYIQALLL